MPLYQYICSKSGKFVERFASYSERNQQICKCGAKLDKLIGNPSFKFVGDGFYCNEYPKDSVPRHLDSTNQDAYKEMLELNEEAGKIEDDGACET